MSQRYRAHGDSYALDEFVASEVLLRTSHARWARETPRSAPDPTAEDIALALRGRINVGAEDVEAALQRLIASGRVEVST